MPEAPPHSPLKLHLSYQGQLDLLKGRNLVVEDDAAALATLQRLGYYRLVGYWFPLRVPVPERKPQRFDEFQKGATFELAVGLYEFDRGLRLLVLDAIERIEVAVRVDIAHLLGRRYRRAHEHSSALDAKFCEADVISGRSQHDDWLAKYAEAVKKREKEDFVAHHLARYGGKMPIWVATEIWDFGLLSKFYAGMKYGDQRTIARRYGVDGPVLESWLRALNFTRNVSAHHSRLWNRNSPHSAKLPETQPHQHLHHLKDDDFARRRTYGALCLMRMMLRAIDRDSDWPERVKQHCATFPASELVSLRDGGFPAGWQEMGLWQ
nr:Abi family protein [Burkholderia multivorans]